MGISWCRETSMPKSFYLKGRNTRYKTTEIVFSFSSPCHKENKNISCSSTMVKTNFFMVINVVVENKKATT